MFFLPWFIQYLFKARIYSKVLNSKSSKQTQQLYRYLFKKKKDKMRKLLLLTAVILPLPLKLFIYRFFGWNIGKNVKIGFSYIDSNLVNIGNGVEIGSFNIIKGLSFFEIGDNSCIKNFNQFFFSGNKAESPVWSGKITFGEKVNVMSHHFIDAGGSINIGKNTTIAGRDTHIWSHGFILVDSKKVKQRYQVNVGTNVYLGARTTVLGSSIPDRAMVGAGSIVNKSFPAENYPLLIAGNPAKIKKRYEFSNDHKTP